MPDQKKKAPKNVDVNSPEALEAAGFGSTDPIDPTEEIANAQAAEATPESPVSSDQDMPLDLSDDPAERLKQVAEVLQEINPNAPSLEQLAQWKQQHGDIFVLYLFDDAFVYRYLKRGEWLKMSRDEAISKMDQIQYEEFVFDKCVLWPQYTLQQKIALPAGTISTLAEQIRANSMFLDPQRLATLTVKL